MLYLGKLNLAFRCVFVVKNIVWCGMIVVQLTLEATIAPEQNTWSVRIGIYSERDPHDVSKPLLRLQLVGKSAYQWAYGAVATIRLFIISIY
jgi:hypothetical protein